MAEPGSHPTRGAGPRSLSPSCPEEQAQPTEPFSPPLSWRLEIPALGRGRSSVAWHSAAVHQALGAIPEPPPSLDLATRGDGPLPQGDLHLVPTVSSWEQGRAVFSFLVWLALGELLQGWGSGLEGVLPFGALAVGHVASLGKTVSGRSDPGAWQPGLFHLSS